MSALVGELSHVYPLGSRINEAGHLEVGGCDALDLAREFGTPAYVVAEDDLRARARAFVEALRARHDDGEVVFASKAFPCTAVTRVFAEEGLGCDVASGGELFLALRGGFAPERIYLHGNAKSEDELAQALDAGVGHVVLDSFEDLERLERLAAGRRPRVLIRVTPGIRPTTHAYISTGQLDSKFGFNLEDAARAIDRAGRSDALELLGLHLHLGSQLFDLDPYRAAVEAIAPLGDFPVYDLGGGLGVAYTASDEPPAIEDYVDALVTAAHDVLGPGKRLLIEPGRALVANAGVTLYTVADGEAERLHLRRPSTAGCPTTCARCSTARATRRTSPTGSARPARRCHVAGKHCESGDVIVRDVELPDPRPATSS